MLRRPVVSIPASFRKATTYVDAVEALDLRTASQVVAQVKRGRLSPVICVAWFLYKHVLLLDEIGDECGRKGLNELLTFQPLERLKEVRRLVSKDVCSCCEKVKKGGQCIWLTTFTI